MKIIMPGFSQATYIYKLTETKTGALRMRRVAKLYGLTLRELSDHISYHEDVLIDSALPETADGLKNLGFNVITGRIPRVK